MSSDIASAKMLNAMKSLINKPKQNDLLFGTINKLDPLAIEIMDGIIIPEKMLFLGQMCRPHLVTIPHTHIYNGDTDNSTTGMQITTTGQAVTTVVDTGHTHSITEQETEDVHRDATDNVTLEIEPKLAVGDKVLMFSFNNNQMYYVAERIEE